MTVKIVASITTTVEAEYEVESESEAYQRFLLFYPTAKIISVNGRPDQSENDE